MTATPTKRRTPSVSFYDYATLIPALEEEDLNPSSSRKSRSSGSNEGSNTHTAELSPTRAPLPPRRPKICSRTYSVPLPSFFTSSQIPEEFYEDPKYAIPSEPARFSLRIPTLAMRRKRSAPPCDVASLRSCLKSRRANDSRSTKVFAARDHAALPDPIYCPAMCRVLSSSLSHRPSSHSPSADPSTSLPEGVLPVNSCCSSCEHAASYGEKPDYTEQWSAVALAKRARDDERRKELDEFASSSKKPMFRGSCCARRREDSAAQKKGADEADDDEVAIDPEKLGHVDELESTRRRLSHISVSSRDEPELIREEDEGSEPSPVTPITDESLSTLASAGSGTTPASSYTALTASKSLPTPDISLTAPSSATSSYFPSSEPEPAPLRRARTSSQSTAFTRSSALSKDIMEALQDADVVQLQKNRPAAKPTQGSEDEKSGRSSSSWKHFLKGSFSGPMGQRNGGGASYAVC